MSKEYSKNIMEIVDFIDIFMPKKCFEYFMSMIFNSIKEHNSSKKTKRIKGIDIITFNIYLNLPFFISEKIFNSIKKNPDDEIIESEFINFFSTIYYGKLEERAKLIFNILDFSQNNVIKIDDVKLLSYHFHLIKNTYKDDLDLILIDEMISSIFDNGITSLSYKNFIEKIKNKNSDLLFLFILFFFKFKPFEIEELELFYLHNSSQNFEEENDYNIDIFDLYPLISPSKNLFHYIKKYLNINNLNLIDKENISDDEEILNELNNFEIDFEKAKNNLNIPKEVNTIQKLGRKTINSAEEDNSIEISPNNRQCKTEKNEKYYLFKSKCEVGIRNNIKDLELHEIHFEKVTIYLSGHSLFIYKSHNNKNSLNIIILKKILEIEEVGNSVLICYIINLNPKVLEINFNLEHTKNRFIKLLKQIVKYKNLNDYYEVNNKIGIGGYGRVFMGKDKKTGKKIAIKSIEKQYNLPLEDQLSIFWELSICKIIKHIQVSYFVKIYHIFESLSHIYIIMEYAGEDLEHSLNKFWPNIDIIFDYMKQIANGIFTLNKFGIIHRDLKIQNIILSFENDDINDETNYEMKEKLKLIDFGFSKILSKNEKTNDSFGTLIYISPEIINHDYYDYKEDVWNFGIIGYFFLTQSFPFFDEKVKNCSKSVKLRNIVKNIEEKNVHLNENLYKNPKEKILAKVVNMSLVKDINKRAMIHDIINELNKNICFN
jgi:tRNA A-37 threonylcarbamoyl transferase component Bud32